MKPDKQTTPGNGGRCHKPIRDMRALTGAGMDQKLAEVLAEQIADAQNRGRREFRDALEKQGQQFHEALENQEQRSREAFEKQEQRSHEAFEKQEQRSHEALEKQEQRSREAFEKQGLELRSAMEKFELRAERRFDEFRQEIRQEIKALPTKDYVHKEINRAQKEMTIVVWRLFLAQTTFLGGLMALFRFLVPV